MTLTELRYLIALDRERHFGRAAERCFVSQPTLSVAIRKLEDQLGIALFERQRGEVGPTPIGRRIIDQARRVLDEADQIKAIAAEGQDELSGRLRLGAIYTVGPYLLPRLVPALRASAPKMPLLIEEGFTSDLGAQLKRNELDLIILAAPFAPPGICSWDLYDEPFVVAVPPEHAWASRERIHTDQLAGEHLLLLGPGHCFRDQVVAACPECEQVPEDGEPYAGSSLETIRHMVASGLGITVLPQTAVRAESDPLLTIRPFAEPEPHRRIMLVWRRSFPRPAAVRAVRDAILASGLDAVNWLKDATPTE
mgnify:CR=1 FL=1